MVQLTATGQTIIDPRAEVLQGRAMRQEPINSGMQLAGRLAALGGAKYLQAQAEREATERRQEFSARFAALTQEGAFQPGADPSAREAALRLSMDALGGKDPVLARIGAMSLAELTKPPPAPEQDVVSVGKGGVGVVTTQQGKEPQYKELRAPTPEAPAKREIRNDPNGIPRYVDDGAPVYPGIEKISDDKDGDDGELKPNELRGIRQDFVQSDAARRFKASRNGIAKIEGLIPKGGNVSDFTAQDDMALLFGFMKILDPTSTVREGEYANAEQTQGVPAQVINFYNRAVKGERLTDDARLSFIRTARNQFQAQVSEFDQERRQFMEFVQGQFPGVADPATLVPDLADKYRTSGAAPVVSAPGLDTDVNDVGQVVNKDTGNRVVHVGDLLNSGP